MIKIFFKILLVIFIVQLSYTSPASAENIRETPVVKVVKTCAPSVVNISTERLILLRQNPFWGNFGNQYDDFFQEYFRNNFGVMKQNSLGSGVIVSKDGLIVTNAHVIHMASKIYIKIKDQEAQEASLIGVDNMNDLALIKINPAQPLQPIQFADDVMIGETAITIGNPLGLESSVSVGVISGTNRTSYMSQANHIFSNLIQTDASMNPGNSGGALLNLEGKLIGINLAMMQNAQNIGFAVSAEKVKKMLIEYDKVKAKLRNGNT